MAEPGVIQGKVVLITGATDGLGRAVARELAALGAELIIHGRDAGRAAATVREIGDLNHTARLRTELADLSSLTEVRALAERVMAAHARLDVLVNNAGIGFLRQRALSRDGHELILAVNYLAPFLLTELLLPLLESSAPARIVNVASAGQQSIDFDNLMLERDYDGIRAYCQSKLAMVTNTFDLAQRLDPERVTVNTLHPATFMPTKMVLEAGGQPMSSLEEGTAATVRLIADAQLDGISGRYFDRQQETRADPQAYDSRARAELRRMTAELVGLPAPT